MLVALGAGYLFGLYSYRYELWPVGPILDRLDLVRLLPAARRDSFERLNADPAKIAVACPPAAADTAVILAFGQSNAANTGASLMASDRDGVVNLFEGTCYRAASPLLGATGGEGEFLTLLGDRLVAAGTYKNVVIVPAAVGGSPIARWQKGRDLNDMLQGVIAGLPAGYEPTHLLWVQGEIDFLSRTPPDVYAQSFASLLETLPPAPVFIAIATRCGRTWRPDNPIAEVQRRLVDDRRVFLGADLDGLAGADDRRSDRCHLVEAGQRKAADAFAGAIARAKAAP